jgi:ribosomal protein S18 acetylase RimI-like enzyme
MSAVSEVVISQAEIEDAARILAVQHRAFLSEAALYDDYSIPPLTETLEQLEAQFSDHLILKAEIEGVIVGSVRGRVQGDMYYIGRLMVHPDCRGRGIGKKLMLEIERRSGAERFELFTGERSTVNLNLYGTLGYQMLDRRVVNPKVTLVRLEKRLAVSTAEARSE